MAVQAPADEGRSGAPGWMVTFADLMSLLLTFFVLLLSFSSMEVSKFNTLSGSIRSAFGLRSPLDLSDRPTGMTFMPNKSTPSEKPKQSSGKPKVIVVKLREALEKAGLSDSGSVTVYEDGVTLRLDGDAVFRTGATALQEDAVPLLDRLVEIANENAGEIRVEGHTDDVPISTPRFPSNWELSAARAGSAVRYLSAKGVPASRMSAVGFADTRPIAPNDTPENRARNRRIEFFFKHPGSADGDSA